MQTDCQHVAISLTRPLSMNITLGDSTVCELVVFWLYSYGSELLPSTNVLNVVFLSVWKAAYMGFLNYYIITS